MEATISTDLFRKRLYSEFAALEVFLPDRVQTALTSPRSLSADVLVWRVTFSYAFIGTYSQSVNTPICARAHDFVVVRPQEFSAL